MTIGARKIAEVDGDFGGFTADRRIEFGVDNGNGAEEEVGDIGEDGGAAGGNEVGGEESVKLGEGAVDADSGCEVVATCGEELAEVGGVPGGELRRSVFRAESDAGFGLQATLTPGSGDVGAAGSSNGRWGNGCHGSSRFILRLMPQGVHPGIFLQRVRRPLKEKEMREEERQRE